MAVPWLYGVGFVITFSALLAKIQRVKLIYQAGVRMQRKMVTAADMIPVMAIMFIIEVGILLTWQFVSPLRWEREVTAEHDGFPTKSVGSCKAGTSGWGFYLGVIVFHVVCLFYALVLCFQTKDISSDLAESSYVSLAVAFMFQVLVLVAPISALVRDNTDIFFFIRAAAVFLQNFTVLILIFVPKVVRRREHNNDPNLQSKVASSILAPNIRKVSQSRGSHSKSGSSRPDRTNSWAGLEIPGVSSSFSMVKSDLEVINEDDELDSSSLHLEQAPPAPTRDRDHNSFFAFDDENSSQSRPFLPPKEVASNWKELGFASEKFARHVVQLLHQSTDSLTRKKICEDIANEILKNAAPGADVSALLSPDEVLSKWEELGFCTEDLAVQIVDLLRRSTDASTRTQLSSACVIGQETETETERCPSTPAADDDVESPGENLNLSPSSNQKKPSFRQYVQNEMQFL